MTYRAHFRSGGQRRQINKQDVSGARGDTVTVTRPTAALDTQTAAGSQRLGVAQRLPSTAGQRHRAQTAEGDSAFYTRVMA